jgi:hypothetical protein
MTWTFTNLAIQIVAGMIGGNFAAALGKEHGFGVVGHTVAGAVVGTLSGYFLQLARRDGRHRERGGERQRSGRRSGVARNRRSGGRGHWDFIGGIAQARHRAAQDHKALGLQTSQTKGKVLEMCFIRGDALAGLVQESPGGKMTRSCRSATPNARKPIQTNGLAVTIAGANDAISRPK